MTDISKIQISKMTTIAQLIQASEYEKFDLNDLITRAGQVATNGGEYAEFVALCRSYDRTVNAGSWNRRPPTVKS